MKTHPDIFSRNLPPQQVYKIRHRFLLKSPYTTVRKASIEAAVSIRDLTIKTSKIKLQNNPKVYNNVRIKHLPENPDVTNLSFSIHIPNPIVENTIQPNRRLQEVSVPPLIYHRKKLSSTFDKLLGDLNTLGKGLEALSKENLTQRSFGVDSVQNNPPKETIPECDPIIFKKLKKIGVDVRFLNSLRKIGAKEMKIKRSKSEGRIQRAQDLRKQLTEVRFRTLEKEFRFKDKDTSINCSDSSRGRSFQLTPVKQLPYPDQPSSTSKQSDFNISRRNSENNRADYKVFRISKPHIRIMNNPIHKLLNKKTCKFPAVKDFTSEDKLADLIKNNTKF